MRVYVSRGADACLREIYGRGIYARYARHVAVDRFWNLMPGSEDVRVH